MGREPVHYVMKSRLCVNEGWNVAAALTWVEEHQYGLSISRRAESPLARLPFTPVVSQLLPLPSISPHGVDYGSRCQCPSTLGWTVP